ncbi:MAG: hypothetical protein OXT74_11985 [Candidatus Poribacteria bacterium]|nr:hypothetical protein [Candidatus Poribacteria bacterium]
MAKKKNRSANIARKRAKRKQEQKSRRKYLAIQKQRRLHGEKSDEERLHEMILQSRMLVDEPELRAITFDTELMKERVSEVLELESPNVEEAINIDKSGDDTLDEIEDEDEVAGEQFRQEVLPHFLTPEFLHNITHALTACETRLNRTGQQRRAEVALVARSIFELAEPQVLVFHPLVLGVTVRTLESLLSQLEQLSESEQREFVQEVIFDIHNLGAFEGGTEFQNGEAGATHIDDSDIAVDPDDDIEEEIFIPNISSEELPARALYQNPDTLRTRQVIEAWDGYRLVNDTTDQIEFLQPELKRYITLTSNRLLLQCTSMTDLEAAMVEVEKQCEPELIYLAKTLVED